ncbi:zinc finger, CCHC-type, retrotransposon gag domain protein, partial [Tanacetum coccineum]
MFDSGFPPCPMQPWDAMLPQIREQVREEYLTSAVASGSNPPPVTIHTWLERFNKQKPRSFEKAVAPFEGDALAWWKAYKQGQRKGGVGPYFDLRQLSRAVLSYVSSYLAGFLGRLLACEEQCLSSFQRAVLSSVFPSSRARALEEGVPIHPPRNLEILRDRDDYDRSEPSDKRHKSGDRYQSATQQNSYRGHDQKNDHQGSDRQGGGGNYRNNNNNNYSRDNNRNSGAGRDQRNRGSQQSRVPSEGYTHPVCTTCGRRHPGECRRAAGTCFKCGQAGHLQRDCKKNIGGSCLCTYSGSGRQYF